MSPCLFCLCLSARLSHALIGYNFQYSLYHSSVYDDHERFCSQVVQEIRSTHIHGFEQSQLNITIDSL